MNLMQLLRCKLIKNFPDITPEELDLRMELGQKFLTELIEIRRHPA